jgi:hypothetical protein
MYCTAIVFFLLVNIAVPPDVAASWIFGDATPVEVQMLVQLPFLQQPWFRVTLFLTVFSILYLAVEILSEPAKRSTYFKRPEYAVRRLLAVRLGYYEMLRYRWMAQHVYLQVVRSQWQRRRFEPDTQAHNGGVKDGRATDVSDAPRAGT